MSVTSNNVWNGWPTMLRPFTLGLIMQRQRMSMLSGSKLHSVSLGF